VSRAVGVQKEINQPDTSHKAVKFRGKAAHWPGEGEKDWEGCGAGSSPLQAPSPLPHAYPDLHLYEFQSQVSSYTGPPK
jgi:hypothetical protein